MPFIKKHHAQETQPSSSFVGRTNEIFFFVHHILQPETPTHNILSISGQGGIGKSTLLRRFIAQAYEAPFKDYCLTATIDEGQSTPLAIMEQFSSQLHLAGTFEKALKQYKEALRQKQRERESLHDTMLQATPDIAGAVLEGIPMAGPLLRESTRIAATHLLKEHHISQMQKSVEFLERSIDELTTAFVTELNRLADAHVTLSTTGHKRQRRVILFLDTFEKTAAEAIPWLLHHFLAAEISGNVVLVMAGRDSIEHAAHDPKPWLPYCESGVIYWMPLHSFTEEETRIYLSAHGIADPEKVATIWHLSRGLPLWLGLLASDLQGDIDPTKDVVTNFLRWISEQEPVKRQLALEATLLSRPFNQDDLEVFSYIPESDRFTLYQWLTEQSFVRNQPQDGRSLYHDVVRDLFRRHLYQRSQKRYYAIRRAIATHYEALFQTILTERGEKEGYRSKEGFELLLAIIAQLFLLPDRSSHFKAVEHVLHAFYGNTSTEQDKKVANVLRELSNAHSSDQISTHAIEAVELLLRYIEAERNNRLSETTALLDKSAQVASFSKKVLAYLYKERGWAYFSLHQKGYQQAIEDFDRALQLNPKLANAYAGRGWCYFNRDEHQRALTDFDHALHFDPKDGAACNGQGCVHIDLGEDEQALASFDLFIKARPKNPWAYTQYGRVCTMLREYEQALAKFDHALRLDSNYAAAYHYRGITYLWLKNLQQARADLVRSWELEPTRRHYGWVVEWAKMERKGPDGEMAERLEAIAGDNPKGYSARLCHGVAFWLRGNPQQAFVELEEIIQSMPKGRYSEGYPNWEAYFWKGLVCVSLGQGEEAITAIEKGLKGLPPALLAPLYWLELNRPDFYANYVEPLLAKHV